MEPAGHLELVERMPNHVLRVRFFSPHQIQQHIVAQMERGVERVRIAFQHAFGHCRLHLLVYLQIQNMPQERGQLLNAHLYRTRGHTPGIYTYCFIDTTHGKRMRPF